MEFRPIFIVSSEEGNWGRAYVGRSRAEPAPHPFVTRLGVSCVIYGKIFAWVTPLRCHHVKANSKYVSNPTSSPGWSSLDLAGLGLLCWLSFLFTVPLPPLFSTSMVVLAGKFYYLETVVLFWYGFSEIYWVRMLLLIEVAMLDIIPRWICHYDRVAVNWTLRNMG